MHIDKPASVRLGMPQDREAIFKSASRAHAENGLAPKSDRKVYEFVDQAIYRRPGTVLGIIGVIEGPGGIEASTGLAVTSWWYSDEWHIEDLWTFVHPEHRRSTHAKDLIQFQKWLCGSTNLDLLVGVLSNHRTEAKVRLYQRQLPQAGAFFLYGHNAQLPQAAE